MNEQMIGKGEEREKRI